MRRLLVVVDVQKDFCEGGALAVEGGNAVAQKIANWFDAHERGPYHKVVATKDWHIDPGGHWSATPDYIDSWPVHCKANSSGAEFNNAFIGIDFDEVFYKGEFEAAYSAFDGIASGYKYGEGEFYQYLINHSITHIDVVGLALDYCVKATAIDAAERGYVTRVLLDRTAAVHSDPASIYRVTEELRRYGVTCA